MYLIVTYTSAFKHFAFSYRVKFVILTSYRTLVHFFDDMLIGPDKQKLMTILWLNKGSSGSSDGKESACNAGDPISASGLGRPTGEGNGYPLQRLKKAHICQRIWNKPCKKFKGWVHYVLGVWKSSGANCTTSREKQSWLHIGSVSLAVTFVFCCWCLVMLALHLGLKECCLQREMCMIAHSQDSASQAWPLKALYFPFK